MLPKVNCHGADLNMKSRARCAPPSSVTETVLFTPRHFVVSSIRRRFSLPPQGDHYVTRLTHTLEVSQIARTISRALNLNEDLTEAIALGHDLGHTPFGHIGEEVLNKLYQPGWTYAPIAFADLAFSAPFYPPLNYFFVMPRLCPLPATVLRGPRLVRALVRVRCPLSGKP